MPIDITTNTTTPLGDVGTSPLESIETWNEDVLNAMRRKKTDAMAESVFDTSMKQIDSARAEMVRQTNIDKASASNKAKAMFESGKKVNDFSLMSSYFESQNVDQTENQEWINTVSSFENASAMAEAYGLPSEYANAIASTSNQAQFDALISNRAKDQKTTEFINNNIGTFGNVSATLIGSLANIDTLLAVAIPYTAGVKVARIMKSVSTALEAEIALDRIRRVRTVAMASMLPASVAAPTIRSIVDDNYTKTNYAVDTLLFMGIDLGLTLRSLNKSLRNTEGMKAHYITHDALSSIDETIIKPTAMKPTDIPKTKEGIDFTVDEIKAKVDEINVNIIKAEKRLKNTRLGKASRAKTEVALKKMQDELAPLKTAVVGITKTKNAAKRVAKIKKLTEEHPTLFRNVTPNHIQELSPVVDDAMQELAQTQGKNLDDLSRDVLAEHKATKFEARTNAKGETEIGVKDGSGKFKPLTKKTKLGMALVALMATESVATAEDGSGGVSSTLQSLAVGGLLLYLGGSIALKNIDKYGGLKNALKKAGGKILAKDTYLTLMKDAGFAKVNKAFNAYNQLQSSIGYAFKATFMNADEAGKKLARDLAWDPENTTNIPASYLKDQMHQNDLALFYGVYNEAWNKFYKESTSGLTMLQKKSAAQRLRKEFNEGVSYSIENPHIAMNAHIMNAGKTISKLNKAIIDDASEAGVKGFRSVDELGNVKNMKENYVTRMLRANNIRRLVKLSDGAYAKGNPTYDTLHETFKKMYASKYPKAEADEIEEFADDYMEHIDDTSSNIMHNSMGSVLGDTTARAKARIELDTSLWKDISISIDNETRSIQLDDVFERDIEHLFIGYSNSMRGHIALAKKDYSSYTEALKIAADQTETVAQRGLKLMVNNLIGVQSYDSSGGLFQFMKGLSNLASPVFLGLSSLMQTKEVGSTLIGSMKSFDRFKSSVDEMKNVLMNRGSDDYITNVAMRLSGNGQRRMTQTQNHRVYADIENASDAKLEGMLAGFNRATNKVRDVAMVVYGIAPLTDWGQRMNAKFNLADLASIVNGKKTLNRTQMEAYGLTDELMAELKPHMILNEKDNLTVSAVEAIEKNQELFDRIGNITFNMGQTQMMQPTIGTTPLMFMESGQGAIMGTLMSFAVNSFVTYGNSFVKGASRMEGITAVDTMLWFGSLYLAEKMKSEIKGTKLTDEEMMHRALMNMPILSVSSIMSAIERPITSAVVTTTEDNTVRMVKDITNGIGR